MFHDGMFNLDLQYSTTIMYIKSHIPAQLTHAYETWILNPFQDCIIMWDVMIQTRLESQYDTVYFSVSMALEIQMLEMLISIANFIFYFMPQNNMICLKKWVVTIATTNLIWPHYSSCYIFVTYSRHIWSEGQVAILLITQL